LVFEPVSISDLNAIDVNFIPGVYDPCTSDFFTQDEWEAIFLDLKCADYCRTCLTYSRRYCVTLSDGTKHELLKGGKNTTVAFHERKKFAELALAARLRECNFAADQIRTGTIKIVLLEAYRL
jgi:hypothetical protein